MSLVKVSDVYSKTFSFESIHNFFRLQNIKFLNTPYLWRIVKILKLRFLYLNICSTRKINCCNKCFEPFCLSSFLYHLKGKFSLVYVSECFVWVINAFYFYTIRRTISIYRLFFIIFYFNIEIIHKHNSFELCVNNFFPYHSHFLVYVKRKLLYINKKMKIIWHILR